MRSMVSPWATSWRCASLTYRDTASSAEPGESHNVGDVPEWCAAGEGRVRLGDDLPERRAGQDTGDRFEPVRARSQSAAWSSASAMACAMLGRCRVQQVHGDRVG